jgi:hypothetical protein
VRRRSVRGVNSAVLAPAFCTASRRLALRFAVSQQIDEFFNRQSSLPKNRPERSPVKLFVVRNHHLCVRFVAPEDDVAPVLPLKDKSPFHQRRNALAA